MHIWKVQATIEQLNERARDSMSEFLDIEFIEIGDDFLSARMPVHSKVRQPIGIMHGGASCVLAESVGSTAANIAVDPKTHYCVGLDINTNHLRSIREGHVIAKAKPYHIGKTTQVWGIEIVNESNQQYISVSRLTMAVLARKTIR